MAGGPSGGLDLRAGVAADGRRLWGRRRRQPGHRPHEWRLFVARHDGARAAADVQGRHAAPAPGCDATFPSWIRERELAREDISAFRRKRRRARLARALAGRSADCTSDQLDIWFIEICRRVRLCEKDGIIVAVKGTSKPPGSTPKPSTALGDPYAPVHKTENKSLTLGEGDFDYRRLTDLLFSGDWDLPLLARPAQFEPRRTSPWSARRCRAATARLTVSNRAVLPLGGRIAEPGRAAPSNCTNWRRSRWKRSTKSTRRSALPWRWRRQAATAKRSRRALRHAGPRAPH